MSKFRVRLITILSIAVLFVLSLSLAVGALPHAASVASAAPVTPAQIFDSDGAGSSVGASEGDETYVQFTFETGAVSHPHSAEVYYRRSLALKWFVADDEATGTLANPGKAQFFSMTFSFGEIAFEEFEIAFEGTEENITKDGKSTNTVVFRKSGEQLEAVLHDSYYDADAEEPEGLTKVTVDPAKDVTVTIDDTDCASGDFSLYLEQDGASSKVGTLTNIGGYYLQWRSSSSDGQTPITFRASFDEEAEDELSQTVLMKSLNCQSFRLNGDGRVVDNASPVLVFNEKIYSFRLGQRFNLDVNSSYVSLDVIDETVSTSRSYYMAKKEDNHYVKPNEEYSGEYLSLTTSTYFMPTEETPEDLAYVSIRFRLDDGESHLHKCPDCGYLYSDDKEEVPFASLPSSDTETETAWVCPGTKDDGSECHAAKSRFTTVNTYVYLTWYADESAVETVGSTTEDEGFDGYYVCPGCNKHYTVAEYAEFDENWTCPEVITPATDDKEEVLCGKTKSDLFLVDNSKFDYIKVDLEAQGPSYLGVTLNEDQKTNHTSDEAKQAEERYAELLTAEAEKVSAGRGAYLYLPSLRDLIGSDFADYRNLRFSICYRKPDSAIGSSASTSTSLRYNNLRVEVDRRGDYTFRIFAQDAAGNAMKYYNDDGQLVAVTTSNVWDIDGIPEFTCFIDYSGPVIEDSDTQTQGYRNTSYTIAGFDIVALDGYKTDYKLYRFDETAVEEKNLPENVYQYLVDSANAAKGDLSTFEGGWLLDYLEEIDPFNDEIGENDEKWDDTDNAYHWEPDSLTFLPQERGYYFVKVDVTDVELIGTTTSAYKVIWIRNQTDTIPGHSNWLTNNVTAVVMFSISLVLLILLVVVWVVKPSDKKVEEVDLDSLKGKKKNRK